MVIYNSIVGAGEPFYEAVRPIAAHTELIVFDLPGHSDEEELYLPAVRSLRSSLFRRTMGLILEGSTFFSSSIFMTPPHQPHPNHPPPSFRHIDSCSVARSEPLFFSFLKKYYQ